MYQYSGKHAVSSLYGMESPNFSADCQSMMLSDDFITSLHELNKQMGIEHEVSGQDSQDVIYPRAPIVLIINGPGRSGKNSFCDIINDFFYKHPCYNAYTIDTVSTVDLVYNAMHCLLDDDERPGIQSDIDDKADDWRQLMHEIKMSWSNYCNGPMEYIVKRYNMAIQTNAVYMYNRLMSSSSATSTANKDISLFCIFSREPAEIRRFVKMFTEARILCYTIYIDGITTPEDYKNECDSNVLSENIHYDFRFINVEGSDGYSSYSAEVVNFAEKLMEFFTDNERNRVTVPFRFNTSSIK